MHIIWRNLMGNFCEPISIFGLLKLKNYVDIYQDQNRGTNSFVNIPFHTDISLTGDTMDHGVKFKTYLTSSKMRFKKNYFY